MNSKELKKEFTDEKTGISYTLVGDYYLPNLVLEPEEKVVLNKYGRMRLRYLKEIQETATKRVNQIIEELKSKSNLTEDMKNSDPLYWVGTMNEIKGQAEEIVYNEIIYK